MNMSSPARDLLRQQPRVVNIGVKDFAISLKEKRLPVVHVDWRPPAGGNSELMDALRKLSRAGL
jgi:FdrA protein